MSCGMRRHYLIQLLCSVGGVTLPFKRMVTLYDTTQYHTQKYINFRNTGWLQLQKGPL